METISLRPTGTSEKFNIIRNYLKFYNNVQVSTTYTIPRSLLPSIDKDGFQSLIFSGLEQLLSIHPILGVTIENEAGPDCQWKRLKTLDLLEVVKFVNEDPYADMNTWTRTAHISRFQKTNILPPWKIVVAIPDTSFTEDSKDDIVFTLALFCHHAIADGLSAGAFHISFLSFLNNQITNKKPLLTTSTIEVPFLPLLPHLEESTPLTTSIFFLILQLFKRLILGTSDPKEWTGPPISSNLDKLPIPSFQSFILPQPTLTTILQKCRSEKTTITSLITLLIAKKISLTYPTHTHFSGSLPISLRKFSGHGVLDMGTFVTNNSPYFSSDPSPSRGYIKLPQSSSSDTFTFDKEFWDSVRATRSYILNSSNSTHNTNIGLLKYVKDLTALFLDMLGKKREHAFQVSNLGLLDGGVKGEGRAWFERVLFSTGNSRHGEPFSVWCVSVKGRGMSVVVGWDEGVLMGGEGVELAGWLEDMLVGLGEESGVRSVEEKKDV